MRPEENIPTILVIFGATGDLAQRKLLPALFDLYEKEYLPTTFRIVGFSRGARTREEFHDFVRDAIVRKKNRYSQKRLSVFLSRIFYQQGFFDQGVAYHDLATTLITLDREIGQCTNKLFHLAVSPSYYETILKNLAHSGLTIPCSADAGWTRVLVEKPFGRDLETAQKLDQLLGKLFREEQIFRIDHYIAKETIQNILTFRFSNTIFEPVWNARYIEKVEIKLLEDIDVGTRGDFYDSVGALRDVGQNHLLQMVAFVAMENPLKVNPDDIRAEREDVLSAIQPITGDAIARDIRRGQYDGYRNENGAAADSETETYFRITAHINNERWRGVPFVLESGKALAQKRTEIVVYFKETMPCFCPGQHEQHHHQNVVTFRIQPSEGITIRFFAKQTGLETGIEPREFSFNYHRAQSKRDEPDAYEKVLFDCIRGDQTLFTSTKEVAAAWRFITPIIEQWHSVPLQIYKKGSGGPVKMV